MFRVQSLPFSLSAASADPPQSALDEEFQGSHRFFDGAGHIFSMYLEMVGEEDKKTAEGWKADADGILIFTGLFSAAVATLISISIQDIRPNPLDTSNFYLEKIYLAGADPNRCNISSFRPSAPPKFSPPTYAVWVNLLWFMSLIISLVCALLATLLQQWARKYIRVTQPRFSPHKRAQVHAFFAEGVETLHLPQAVQVLPTLLHLSLFLFLAGVVVFLCHVNRTIFELLLPWVCICAVLYGCITVMPIFRHSSPYYTPLSSSVWFIVNGITFVVLRTFRWSSDWLRRLEEMYRQSFLQGMQKTIDGTAQSSPSRIDGRVVMRTFDSLEKDDELERFFMGMPGFRSSKVIADLPGLTKSENWRLFEESLELMDRTFSSDFLTDKVKDWRTMICAKAIDPAEIPGAFRWILDRILTEHQYSGLKTAEFGHIVRRWANGTNNRTTVTVQTIVSVILERARKRDDSWSALATKQLGVSEPVFQGYPKSDNSVSLANLIHITERLFRLLGEENPLSLGPIVLEAVSKFDIHNTSLGLQHDFCALWNQIVSRGGSLDAREILKYIRHVYVALHEGTNAAPTQFSGSASDPTWILDRSSSYPLCTVHGHHSDSTSQIQEVTAPTSGRAVLHHNIALNSAPLSGTSFHPAHPTTVEYHHIAATSLDPDTANATQRGADISAGTIPHSMSETSTSNPPLASTSSPSPVALQHNADPRTSPDTASSLPIPVPEIILTTDPPLPSESPMTGSNHAYALPESHSLMLATAPPSTPRLTCVPDLGATAEDGGSSNVILHNDKDALDPSVNHADTMAITDLPP